MKPDKPTYEQPPKRLTRFVARLVAPHLREEVLGDLHERYACASSKRGRLLLDDATGAKYWPICAPLLLNGNQPNTQPLLY